MTPIDIIRSAESQRFKRRLYFAFVGIVASLIVAVAVSIFSSRELNNEMEHSSGEVIPAMLVAMRMSEQGALMAASLHGLVGSETDEMLAIRWFEIDQLRKRFFTTYQGFDYQALTTISVPPLDRNLAEFSELLKRLRENTEQRIVMEERQRQSLASVVRLHSNLVDTVSPVVYGISSLSKLFARQDGRRLSGTIKSAFAGSMVPLGDLLKNQVRLMEGGESQERTLKLLENQSSLLLQGIALLPKGERDTLLGQLDAINSSELTLSKRRLNAIQLTATVSQQMVPLVDSAQKQLIAESRGMFSKRTEETTRDLGYAMDIKAEGNLLVALLTSVVDADSEESLSVIQERFIGSMSAFRGAVDGFESTRLAQRNPILASNVSAIRTRLEEITGPKGDLFLLREEYLVNLKSGEALLVQAHNSAAALVKQIETIVTEMSHQTNEARETIRSEGRNYLLILLLVGGTGIGLSLLIAVTTTRTLGRDQTVLQLARKEVEDTNLILEAVGFSAKRMLTAESWQDEIDEVLSRLGEATRLSRVYLYSLDFGKVVDKPIFTKINEWSRSGVESAIDHLQLHSDDGVEVGLERLIRILHEGNPVYGSVDDFPEKERLLLKEQNILSLLITPIMVNRSLWGFLGFDDLSKKRDWSTREVNALNAAADTLGSAISHDLASHEIRQAAAVFENTKEGVLITDQENRIIAINRAFTEITGYREKEVLGKGPDVLKSDNHEQAFYDDMWADIKMRGQWQGEIVNKRKDGTLLPEWLSISTITDSQGKVIQYVGVFSDISKLKRTEERLEFLAHHDPLTDLPNRLLLTDRLYHSLSRCQRNGTQIAVIFFDLDRFKNINDTLGHHVGDLLLQQVSKRLENILRSEDTIARLGGDEFVILLEEVESASQVALVAEKVKATVTLPYRLDERDLYVTASLGISLYPDHGSTVETLMKNADAAMYKAKESGRNNYQFYTSALTETVFSRLSMENQLRKALDREEFELYYQPQCITGTGAVIGLEALIRWKDPSSGELIPPGRFLTVAEEAGLILPIGEWVLNTACTQSRIWQESGFDKLCMAVNLSAKQLDHEALLPQIESALKLSGIHGSQLELELTESFIMNDPNRAAELLGEIRELGISLAIDDFGTGYSSLSYLKLLPFQKLKIDREFVNDIPGDPNDMAICRAIVGLGHTLQMTVIAEGVESLEQYRFLRSVGCDYIQGYLLSMPLSTADATELLVSGNSLLPLPQKATSVDG